MQIIEHKKNPVLKREEIVLFVEKNETPSKNEVIKEVGEHFKKDQENIVIQKIEGLFGIKKSKITVKIYDDLESKNKFETVAKKLKKKAEEKKE